MLPSLSTRRRRVLKWILLTAAALFVAGAGAVAYGYTTTKIPAANEAALAQNNTFLYADGSLLAKDGDVDRENMPLSRVPEHVRHAVLAAENRDFYHRPAVDPVAMARAGWKTLRGDGVQSGSTITQQYVKNLYLTQEQSVTRKAREIFMAVKVDQQMSKDDILEGYLNTSYYGRGAYGIQAAAHAYFGKDAEDLDVSEGAFLAAALNSPTAYDVVAHPENKKMVERRVTYVLDGMRKEHWLSAKGRKAAGLPELTEQGDDRGLSGQRGYLVEAVKSHLIDSGALTEKELAAGGYRITTTIQKPRQNALVKAVDDELVAKLSDSRKADQSVRAGAASIDPRNGEVVALYGGRDYAERYVSNATRRDYQVGSVFKPFVFTAALDKGATTADGQPIGPDTVYDGTSRRPVTGFAGYSPQNEDDISYGRISVQRATDASVNSVYAQMAQDTGPKAVRDTAVALGIPADTPDLNAYPSIALGPATASVLDITSAYASLAAHGQSHEPVFVKKLTRQGDEVALPEPEQKRAVSREAADTTTSVLQGVVEDGSGAAAQATGRPAAGKTGTGEHNRSAWFSGYTPELATSVALFGQDPKTGAQTSLHGALGEARINGGGYPTRIWAAYQEAALKGLPVTTFDLQDQEPVAPIVPPTEGPQAPVAPEPTDEPEPSREPETSAPPEIPDADPQDTPPAEPDPEEPTEPEQPDPAAPPEADL
ncbi:penicillin-binding protein [Streptomyces sp. A7024]|uniref:Penicillin-binding protein n=1 Tax=Streptomyces coryli TaxID=1128680 RepID=A0A6G4UCC9_9ACTN|nr:transglycosylase domain-containing protein [Streptomyces coryli]NGN69370.1 penicillin-binding protein [Streptomyces coryli]